MSTQLPTRRQAERWIINQFNKHGRAPTITEFCSRYGVGSVSTGRRYLVELGEHSDEIGYAGGIFFKGYTLCKENDEEDAA